MAGELYDVLVKELKGTRVTLELTTRHPDAGKFYADKVFALRLLYDTARDLNDEFEYEPNSALGRAFTFDQSLSEEWTRANAGQFVSSVVLEPRDLPEEPAVGTKATYAIEVTDAKWLEHLTPGQTWQSTAYPGYPPES